MSPRYAINVCVLLLAAALLHGCGYGFAPKSGPSVLNDKVKEGKSTLAIRKVENPTLQTWLEPTLRNDLRDEITSRASVTWVQPDAADMLLDLNITRYIIQAAIQDEKEKTLRYQVELVLEATLVDAAEGTVIWQSGPIRRIEFYLNDAEKSAAERDVVFQAVRVLVDHMGHSF